MARFSSLRWGFDRQPPHDAGSWPAGISCTRDHRPDDEISNVAFGTESSLPGIGSWISGDASAYR